MQTSTGPAAVMPVVRWHGQGDVRVEDIPVPGPAAPRGDPCRGRVVRHLRLGSARVPLRSAGHPTRPQPGTGRCAPMVLGHEVSGWVEQAGADVTGLVVGDLVVLSALLPCRRCAPCGRGAVRSC